MYLSNLLIDLGTDPDRPRPGRLWLRNVYHVHQRLCMGFPAPSRKEDDPEFLMPFHPDDFPQIGEGKPAQPSRSPGHGFLFRVDPLPAGRAVILLQSAARPDWNYAFQNARMFLAADPEVREFSPAFATGDTLRFRIRINLSKKSRTSNDGVDLRTPRPGLDKLGRERSQSKRVALTWDKDRDRDEAVREWFESKGTRNGFTVSEFQVVNVGWVVGNRPKTKAQSEGDNDSGRRIEFRSALLEGTLTVADAELFAHALALGIGSAKAFGFGLLSVMRA